MYRLIRLSKGRFSTDYRLTYLTQHKFKGKPEDNELKQGDLLESNKKLLAYSPENTIPISTNQDLILKNSDENENEHSTIQLKDLNNVDNDLYKDSQPPPLPVVRYDEERSLMPSLLATENSLWFGAHGWDAPEFKPYTREERLAIFERRKKDLPDGYTYAGKRLVVLPDPHTGELIIQWKEPHGPIVEHTKRQLGRFLRNFSYLDRTDDMYETRVRQKYNILETVNNRNSELQYSASSEKIMRYRDRMLKNRQVDRETAKMGFDSTARDFICSLFGCYRINVVDIPEAKKYDTWYTIPEGCFSIAKEYLSKEHLVDEIKSHNMGQHMHQNIWMKEHLMIEAIDVRFSLIDSYGMDRFDGLKYVRYLNLKGCRFFDDYAMVKLHYLSESLEYLDLSQTRVTLRGFNFMHLLTNLKWLNLSNMIDLSDEEIHQIIPLLRAVLPPDCIIVTTLKTDPNIPLISSGEEPFLKSIFSDSLDNDEYDLNEVKNLAKTKLAIYDQNTSILPEDILNTWNVSPMMQSPQQKIRKRNLLSMNEQFDKYTNKETLNYLNMANVEKPLF